MNAIYNFDIRVDNSDDFTKDELDLEFIYNHDTVKYTDHSRSLHSEHPDELWGYETKDIDALIKIIENIKNHKHFYLTQLFRTENSNTKRASIWDYRFETIGHIKHVSSPFRIRGAGGWEIPA